MGCWDNLTTRMEARMTTGAIGQAEDMVKAFLHLVKDKNATRSMVETTGGTLLS
jgi:hypothetical protein